MGLPAKWPDARAETPPPRLVSVVGALNPSAYESGASETHYLQITVCSGTCMPATLLAASRKAELRESESVNLKPLVSRHIPRVKPPSTVTQVPVM